MGVAVVVFVAVVFVVVGVPSHLVVGVTCHHHLVVGGGGVGLGPGSHLSVVLSISKCRWHGAWSRNRRVAEQVWVCV